MGKGGILTPLMRVPFGYCFIADRGSWGCGRSWYSFQLDTQVAIRLSLHLFNSRKLNHLRPELGASPSKTINLD